MEQKEFRDYLERQNTKLKQSISVSTASLYALLEEALDASLPHPSPQSSPSSSCPSSVNSHDTLRSQLQSLALQQQCYNNGLLCMSQSLINQQILHDQSSEMQVLLMKYQERILPTRSQLVDKENELYYAIRNHYECFEDQYENFVPRPERLTGVQGQFESKSKMWREYGELARERHSWKLAQLQLKQNKEDHGRLDQKDANPVGNDHIHEEIQQLMEDEEFQWPEIKIGQGRCLTDLTNNQEVLKQQEKNSKSTLSPKTISIPLKASQQSLAQQQSTSTSFKNSSAYKNFNQISKCSQSSTKGVPNFSQMSKYDFNLFRVYFYKIERQSQRAEKLLQQYNNYLQVYKVINDDNQKIGSLVRSRQAGIKKQRAKSRGLAEEGKIGDFEIKNKFHQFLSQNLECEEEGEEQNDRERFSQGEGGDQLIIGPGQGSCQSPHSSYLAYLAKEMNAQADKNAHTQNRADLPPLGKYNHNCQQTCWEQEDNDNNCIF